MAPACSAFAAVVPTVHASAHSEAAASRRSRVSKIIPGSPFTPWCSTCPPRDSNPYIAGFRQRAPISYPAGRSEEHTSELQSHSDLVCRLLLEKKQKNKSPVNVYRPKKEKTRT